MSRIPELIAAVGAREVARKDNRRKVFDGRHFDVAQIEQAVEVFFLYADVVAIQNFDAHTHQILVRGDSFHEGASIRGGRPRREVHSG